MNAEFGMRNAELMVDHAAHRVWFRGHCFPCDRDIEACAIWQEHALLLSSDTDCLSLWDADGLVRTAQVGVYPQDMTVTGETAYVCGGADGCIHLLHLPELQPLASLPLPGMPERICVAGEHAYVLTLLADSAVYTALMQLDHASGSCTELACYPGLPGAIAVDADGIWLGVSETVLHLPWNSLEPDAAFEGFGLPHRIELQGDAVIVQDPLAEMIVQLRRKPHPSVEVLHRGETPLFGFS